MQGAADAGVTFCEDEPIHEMRSLFAAAADAWSVEAPRWTPDPRFRWLGHLKQQDDLKHLGTPMFPFGRFRCVH